MRVFCDLNAEAGTGWLFKLKGNASPAAAPTRAGKASSSSSLPIFWRLCSPHLNSLSWRSTSVKRTDMTAGPAQQRADGRRPAGAGPVARPASPAPARALSSLPERLIGVDYAAFYNAGASRGACNRTK